MTLQEEEKIWGLIAWLIPLVGPVLALVLRPNLKYVKHWSFLSIGFFILVIAGYVVLWIVDLFLSLVHLGILAGVLSALFWLLVVVLWIIGIVKAAQGEYWRPVLVYDIAQRIGLTE